MYVCMLLFIYTQMSFCNTEMLFSLPHPHTHVQYLCICLKREMVTSCQVRLHQYNKWQFYYNPKPKRTFISVDPSLCFCLVKFPDPAG